MIEQVPDDERLDRREWVEPELTDAGISAGFQTMLAKEAKAGTSARAAVVSAVAMTAVAAAALFAVFSSDESASSFAGTELTTQSEATTVSLADGSSIEAQPHTSLAMVTGEEDEMAFALTRGAATFEVAPNPNRQFIVRASDVTVRVVGTRFTVSRDVGEERSAIEVVVARGIVEVVAGGETRRLTAGERWSRTDAVTPSDVLAAGDEPRAEEELATDGRLEIAPSEEGEDTADRTRRARPGGAGETSGDGAERLFEAARVARAEGRYGDAAEAYERLVSRHRGDDRAGLAALALGRLRMDRMGDPRGAATAFTTALRLAPNSPLREDTMARLVRAHEASGNGPGCDRAKASYLTRYPEGRHASDIAARCN